MSGRKMSDLYGTIFDLFAKPEAVTKRIVANIWRLLVQWPEMFV